MIRIALIIFIFAAASFAGHARAADPVKIPFKVVEAAFKTAKCTNELKDEELDNVSDLGGGLKLVEVYCWRAAYQAGSIFLAVDPKAPGKARLLRFQMWGKQRSTAVYSLTSPDFDPQTKKLASFHKGRGMGDCGGMGEWKWTGANFKLTGYWFKENCDGQPFDDDKKWRVFPPK